MFARGNLAGALMTITAERGQEEAAKEGADGKTNNSTHLRERKKERYNDDNKQTRKEREATGSTYTLHSTRRSRMERRRSWRGVRTHGQGETGGSAIGRIVVSARSECEGSVLCLPSIVETCARAREKEETNEKRVRREKEKRGGGREESERTEQGP
jgi:hypothetical protein